MRRSSGHLSLLSLALLLVGVFSAIAVTGIAVTGASGADFEIDDGPCPGTPGNAILSRCTTGYVGQHYEIQLTSEKGSGCWPYDYFQIVNSALPDGLTMTPKGLISGMPTSAGFTRFWLWDRDQTFAEGGPDWCQFEDRSEREFSIPVDPGLAIDNQSVKPATIGQAYSETLSASQVVTLNPRTGGPAQATWTVQSGALAPGLTLSESGALTGTPTAEGSYQFVVKAVNGSPFDTKAYTLAVRQAVSVKSPLGAQRPSAEVGIRVGKTFAATGGSGTYAWAVASGALPPGVALDAAKGTISGTPRAAGNFAFALTATDSEGRVATASAAMIVAPRLAIKTRSLKAAKLGGAYEAKLATTGGAKPLKWKLVSGKLPLGVRFAPRLGTFVGTPRRSGTFRVALEASDALGAKARSTLVLRVKS